MSPQPAEVWLADLGLAAKTRPVVIVSRFNLETAVDPAIVAQTPLSASA